MISSIPQKVHSTPRKTVRENTIFLMCLNRIHLKEELIEKLIKRVIPHIVIIIPHIIKVNQMVL
jgi:hypothetical protein